jgi:hypothetical protein
VSPLFGRSGEKAAQEEAARAEVARLSTLSVSALAAEIMPGFGPGGPRPAGFGTSVNSLQIANWLMASHPRAEKYLKQLIRPINEGIQALVTAGLVEDIGRVPISSGGRVRLTALGETALAEGTVREHL